MPFLSLTHILRLWLLYIPSSKIILCHLFLPVNLLRQSWDILDGSFADFFQITPRGELLTILMTQSKTSRKITFLNTLRICVPSDHDYWFSFTHFSCILFVRNRLDNSYNLFELRRDAISVVFQQPGCDFGRLNLLESFDGVCDFVSWWVWGFEICTFFSSTDILKAFSSHFM